MAVKPVRLRPGVEADREFLWRLHCETMREYVELTWGWDEGWQRARFDAGFVPGDLEIVEADGVPVGYVSVRRLYERLGLAVIGETETHYSMRGASS